MSTPTTPQTTYFGDVNVYGNTTMSGVMNVYGTPALFYSNLGVVTDGTSLIGTSGTSFQYAWITAANTTSVNFLTNIQGPIGIATTATGSVVNVQGNVLVSNSISTTNVSVTTSINTGSVMNVNFVAGRAGVGIGTNVVGSAALAVLGTMNAVTSFRAASLILSGTLNVTSANIFSIASTNVGVGTTPVTGGATLSVQGFGSVSNSVSTTNIYTTTANVGTINTRALINSSGFIGIGTSAASGTNMWVLGDLRSSNAINAPVMTSTGLNASGRINAASVVARSNVGVGIAPVQGGPALAVSGNVFLSNAFTTPQVFANFMNVANRSNIVTGVATSNVLIGPTADQYIGFNLVVDGNVVVSNALQSADVTAADLINVGSSANLLAIMSPFSLGVSNPINGARAFFSLDNTYDDTAVVPSYTTAPSVTGGSASFSSGTGPAGQDTLSTALTYVTWSATNTTPVTSGLTIAGWVYFTSAMINAQTGVFDFYGRESGGGADEWYMDVYIRLAGGDYKWSCEVFQTGGATNTISSSTNIVLGTWHYVAVTIGTDDIFRLYLNGTLIGSGGVPRPTRWPYATQASQYLDIGGSPYGGFASVPSARFSAFAVYSAVLSKGQLSLLYSSGTFSQPALSPYGILGNFYASNTLTIFTANTFVANAFVANVVSVTARTSVGIRTAADATGNTELLTQGNVFISNSLTAANVYATNKVNTATLNTTSIFTTSTGFLGISTTVPSGTTLYVPGNTFVSNSFSGGQISVVNSNSLGANSSTMTCLVNMGVGTEAGGSSLAVQGNAFISNAVTTTNIYATTSANVQTLNTGAIFTTSTGFLGVGTSAPSGTSLYVLGNVYVSNALSTTSVIATAMNVTGLANTTNFTMATGQFLGIGTTPTGNALEVSGNAFVSNAVTATNVFSTLANLETLNTLSIFTRNSFLGFGTSAASGTSLFVLGNVYASTSTNTPAMFTPAANVAVRANAATFTTGTAGIRGATGATLSVTGNLYASNAITTTNVVATSANVTRFANVTSLAQIQKIGIGGAALNVSGNVVGSDGFTTTNVLATSVNTATMNVTSVFGTLRFVGIATAAASGTALYVQGNLYASNALTTGGDILATSMNLTSTLNTGSITSAILLVDELGWSNTNIFISNSITTTNVFTTNVNAASYVGTSGSIGIGTAGSGYTLQIQGNLASSNTLWSLPDVSALQSIYYVDDITKRSPHLLPTPSNAVAIQSWISATCNAASQPTDAWWSTSPTPIFCNVASGPNGNNDYCGGVMLPDGRVLFVPSSASNVGIFNPTSGEFSTIIPAGLTGAANKYRGGILTPNGNVIFVPFQTNNVGVYNPLSEVFSNIGPYNVGTNGFEGGVLATNGKAIFVPRESPNVGVFDWTSLTMSNVTIQGTNTTGFLGGCLLPNGNVVFIPGNSQNVGMLSADQSIFSNIGPFFTAGGSKFVGGVLAPNGNVIMTPGFLSSANVAIFNPTNSTCSNVNTGIPGSSGAFQGAALLPSGNVVFAPCASANVGLFDPIAITYSNLVTSLDPSVFNKFYGATLIPDGRVVFTPMASNNVAVLSTFTPAPVEFCLSPYFNKF